MTEDVAAAQARAELARARLTATVGSLQTQLTPARLGKTALTELKGGGDRAARASADVARRHPAVVSGALGLAALLLARKRVAALIGKAKKPAR